MANTYITDKGLEKPTLVECIQQIGDAMESVVGPVNREADSTTGQWIGIEAEANAIHFEALEYLWNSRFLSSAEGMALDAIGSWFGLSRIGQTATKVNAVIYGNESTAVPAGSIASFDNYQFKLDVDTVISRADLVDGQFRIDSVAVDSFTIRINGVDITYVKTDGDTTADIAERLAGLINSTEQFDARNYGSSVYLTSKSKIQGYPVSLTSGMTWIKIGSPALFTSTVKGSVSVPVGGLSIPISAISGWVGINNFVAGSTGSDRESDTDYRRRLTNSRSANNGAATESAISARIIDEVPGVTLVVVLENDTMDFVDDMPPKSIQCIVDGGLEQQVADAIWKYKAAGIETSGSTSITIRDTQGRSHLVSFSRPVNQSIYIKIIVTLLDDEEELSQPVVSLIKEGVKNYFNTLGLGDDVIAQRLYGYIYTITTGLGKLNITVSSDGDDFSENNISIPASVYATVSDENIEVTGV
ncbi:Baseplate J-like protein [Paramixta manurensis]|uniref:Baseplate J-like protein n=1 Tax=Paramixta manurensis TaxID=2740817 RepID=A0A6M8UIP2_9GAMM|nr:Baseplate J-like protein [Erwiniaceae bacterium PD-1]